MPESALGPVVCEFIKKAIPDVVAVYIFGSAATGATHQASDVDVAVLPRAPLDGLARFSLQEELARVLGRDVDLVDLSAASTVLRVEVLRADALVYDGDRATRERFEAHALADSAHLNEKRRGILEDVRATGRVHG